MILSTWNHCFFIGKDENSTDPWQYHRCNLGTLNVHVTFKPMKEEKEIQKTTFEFRKIQFWVLQLNLISKSWVIYAYADQDDAQICDFGDGGNGQDGQKCNGT